MTAVNCPFCDHECQERKDHQLGRYFRIFDCEHCHAELKQNLVRGPEAASDAVSSPNTACEDCMFSDLQCMDCGDPICEKHVRTIGKYAKYLSPEPAALLEQRYGSHVFCPLCFQAAVSRPLYPIKEVGEKKPTFRAGVILALSVAFFVIVVGLRNCSKADIESLRSAAETRVTSPAPSIKATLNKVSP